MDRTLILPLYRFLEPEEQLCRMPSKAHRLRLPSEVVFYRRPALFPTIEPCTPYSRVSLFGERCSKDIGHAKSEIKFNDHRQTAEVPSNHDRVQNAARAMAKRLIRSQDPGWKVCRGFSAGSWVKVA